MYQIILRVTKERNNFFFFLVIKSYTKDFEKLIKRFKSGGGLIVKDMYIYMEKLCDNLLAIIDASVAMRQRGFR